MLVRFQKDVLDLNPTDLFIMGGTNDLLSNRNVQSIADNIELIIKDSLKENINVIIGFPPNIIPHLANKLFMKCATYDYCQDNLPRLKESLLNLCNKYSLDYIDFYSATIDANEHEYLYVDGIHFSPEGHDLLVETAENKFN